MLRHANMLIVATVASSSTPSCVFAQSEAAIVSAGDVHVPRAGGRVVDGFGTSVMLAFSGAPPEAVARTYRAALTEAGCSSPSELTADGTDVAFSCVQRDGHWLSIRVSGGPSHAFVNVSAAHFGPFWFRLDGDRSSTLLGPETFIIYSDDTPAAMLARYRTSLERAGCSTARFSWPEGEGARWVCARSGTTYALTVSPHTTGSMAKFFALDATLLRFPAEGALTVEWSHDQLDVTYPPGSTLDAVARFGALFASCHERESGWEGREFECRRGRARYVLTVAHGERSFFVRVAREHAD